MRRSAALQLIHDQPQRAWTLSALDAEAGLSRAAFARRFKDLVGASPHAYLTEHRMASAARLLRDSDLPLDSVARRVGYGSSYAFAKTFKRENGTAPGRYRTASMPD